MTTPRIEEMVENFMRTKGDRAKLRSDIVELVTEAHQAGIDEAVGVINSMPFHYGNSGFGCFIDKDDTIKALQNNK